MVLKCLYNFILKRVLDESRVSPDVSDTSSAEISPSPPALHRSHNSPGPPTASTSSRESRRARSISEGSGEPSAKKRKTLEIYQTRLLEIPNRPFEPSSYRLDPTATKLCTPIKGKPYLDPVKFGYPYTVETCAPGLTRWNLVFCFSL